MFVCCGRRNAWISCLMRSSVLRVCDICGLLRAIDLRCLSLISTAILQFVPGSHPSTESSALHVGGLCPLSNSCLAGRKMSATLAVEVSEDLILQVCLLAVNYVTETSELLSRCVEVALDRSSLVGH